MSKLIGCLMCLTSIVMSLAAIAAPVPAEKLFQNPTSSLLDMSPDGQWISYLTRIDDQTYLTVQDIETKQPLGILVLRDDEVIHGYSWLDERTLLLSAKLGHRHRMVLVYKDSSSENDTWKNIILKRDGYLVSSLPNDKQHVLLAIVENHKTITSHLYKFPLQALRDGDMADQYKMPGISENLNLFSYSDELDRLISLQIDQELEKIFLSIGRLGDEQSTKSYELNTEESDFVPVGLLSESKMAVLSDKDTDTLSLFEFDLASKTFGKQLYSHKSFDLVGAQISPVAGKVISVSYYDHGKLTTEYLDTDSAANSALLTKHFGNEQISVALNNALTGKQILEVYSSSKPRSYYLYDRKKEQIEYLLPANDKLEMYQFAKTEMFHVTSKDGTSIDAYLTKAEQPNHNTLLIMPHGGPIGVMDTVGFDPSVQYFVSRGFSVLKVNYRGSSGYGNDFRNSGVGQWGKMIEEDISAAMNKVLKDHKYQHMCAMGSSYGAYSSMMLALKHPDKIKCVVGAFGVYDLPLMFNSSNYAVLEEERKGWADVIGEFNDKLFDVSPVYLAQNLNVPILLIGGVKDKITTIEHTRRMEYVLKKHDKDVQAVYYQKAAHGHNSWYGDWHEQTLTYQFLLDSLALPDLDIAQIPSADVKMIQDEYIRLGATFFGDNWVNQDLALSLKYFKMAALMGSPRGLYSEGWLYEHSAQIETDLPKAIALYQQASDKGFSNASFELAEHYYSGKAIPRDYAKSFALFSLAKQQEHNAIVNVKLANAFCLGHGVEQSDIQCIELLDLAKLEKDQSGIEVDNKSYAERRKSLAKMLLSADLSSETRRLLKLKIQQWHGIDSFEVDVEEDDFGRLKNNSRKKVYDDNHVIRRTEDGLFGASLDVDIKGTFDNNSTKTIFLVNWKMHHQDGKISDQYTTMLWGYEGSDWFANL
ncbi:prolyl oligopeptidase family serine peptidase [Aliiglaciecola sp. LCG003]|uniref:prolyl oligopeptidase family serine peptidase n=1 Tax=Aliiglaciecola sp. LCG003 TaxID=3053655 RepID=UPI0025743EC0|nr:prolyl oligopeptidase family serine peptidase [Aliiglaciecola sp. LCG003]WJG10540.1 prolyl oligopeptidase family serine peptidase [Aliiglaciecola sp. LCG003]